MNTKYGTHLRRILNTTSTHTGFLDFMSQAGVGYEAISYHDDSSGTSPYALAASQPGSGKELVAPLRKDWAPTSACLTNLRTQIGCVEHQTEVTIESVYVYELLAGGARDGAPLPAYASR